MKSSEAAEAGQVLGEALVAGAHRAGQVSVAVVDRGYAVAQRLAGPSRAARIERMRSLHRRATTAAAGSIGRGLQIAGRAAGQVGARLSDGRPLVEEARPHHVVSILNGLYGDRLRDRQSPLSLPMAVRAAGRDVAATPEGLRTAYPDAAGLVAVFLHGLIETDDWWDIRSERNWGHPGESYSRKMLADGVWTPVRVRYNTGLRISDNGRTLADLLTELVAGWPVPVRGLVLIGHSMGGLVVHSALAQSGPDQHWRGLVRVTVTIGTPHQGAAIARGVARLHPMFAKLPETAWLAELIAARPAGMGDLGHGNLLPDDWRDLDPGTLMAEAGTVPLADGIRHCVVIGTVPSKRDGLVARWVGDLLVRPADARLADRRGEVDARDIRVVGGARHLDLLNHPAVYLHVSEWLAYAARKSPQV